ncbi:MAG: hypothetical protein IJS81_08790 [Selenomonadaceae bacterium]|nr:hypothetical protein [Selenomonadaceae bacterium]
MCVKKFLIITALFMTIFSTCNAAQVRLSNMNAETFLNKMASMLHTDNMKKISPIAITKLIRDEKSDMPEYNLKAWGSLFAVSESSPPEGYVVFLTDTADCVNSMKFVFKVTSDWYNKYQAMLLSALWTLDFTPQEAAQLIKGGETENEIYTSAVKIPRQDKAYVLIMNKIEDKMVVLLMATDGGK